MKKVVSSILMTVVLLANLFAPVSVGWGDKKIEVVKNIASAVVEQQYTQCSDATNFVVTGTTVSVMRNCDLINIDQIEGAGIDPEKLAIKVTLKDSDGQILTSKIGNFVYKNQTRYSSPSSYVFVDSEYGLTSNTNYTADLELINTDNNSVLYKINSTSPETEVFTTTEAGDTKSQVANNAIPQSSMPECGVTIGGVGSGTIYGCVAQVIYYVIFMPSSVLFALAGTFFDNTFAYSVNDNSYRSAFVVQGWNVVRDFCNMFFIFVLLYIAFKTILDLNGAKTKEMIINVIIIGLLINFSLFATRVIIDVSNVLARVFYNSNTIQITALNEDGGGVGVTDTIAKMNKTGVLPLSAALVNKVNPQSLIINAGEYGEIPDKAGRADTTKNAGGITTGTFIFVTLLASGINIVGFIVFLVVGLMFVARVIGLWLAMILAPFAFFSYTVPAMQDLDTVGFKKWWPETLKLAFLAPVFIFFLYLILQFLEVGLGIADLSNKEGMLNKLVAIVIPFAFIMVLLMQAKKIAVKMAGQAGSAVSKFGAVAGGLALGAATGGAAMLGRATLGRAAANLSQSNKFRDWAGRSKIGASALKMTSGVASKSFDARGVKVMGKGLSDTGLKNVGKAKEGGFTKIREDKVKKEEEFANKMLDTSDYGIAELQGGKISTGRSDMIMDQIEKSGGDFGKDKNNNALSRDQFRMKLAMGLDADTARKVADQMNSARREDRAKKFENSKFMTNRIKANKIRKTPKAIKDARQFAITMASLAAAQKAIDDGGEKPVNTKTTPTTQTPQNTTTNTNPSS